MEKIAFLFTGQGAQYVGMGKTFYDEYEVARQTFEEANDVLGFDLTKICFEGSLGELSKPENIQPALLTVSVAAYRVYMKEIGIAPHFYAGHSLGEYAALTCSGAIRFSDAVKIVRERGLLTKQIIESDIGAMTIIDGIDSKLVEGECKKISTEQQFVSINCYNSPLQVAVAGHKEAVELLEEKVLEMDGNVTPLFRNAPFHSPLMQDTAEKLKGYLDQITFFPFRNAVISNPTALPFGDYGTIADKLAVQMIKPVKWQETMQFLKKYGVTLAIEMGPKNVLCNLVKGNTPEIDAFCFGQREDRNILFDRLNQNEMLKKHVPTVITKCLAVAVSTPNKNWDNEEYRKNVVEPYANIQKMQEELDEQGALPTKEQMIEALEMLRTVLQTKKVPVQEQIEWFHHIFEETATYYEFKDFDILQENKFEKVT